MPINQSWAKLGPLYICNLILTHDSPLIKRWWDKNRQSNRRISKINYIRVVISRPRCEWTSYSNEIRVIACLLFPQTGPAPEGDKGWNTNLIRVIINYNSDLQTSCEIKDFYTKPRRCIYSIIFRKPVLNVSFLENTIHYTSNCHKS